MFAAQDFKKLSRRFHRIRRHAAAVLMICLFCSVGGRPLHAGGELDDSSDVGAAFAEMYRTPEDFFQTHDHMIEFFRSHERIRDVSLKYAGDAVLKFSKKTKATEDDGEMFIGALELVSYIIDPRAEDILLSDVAFDTGWIVMHGVARQDPATVVPKLIRLFDQNPRTKFLHSARANVGFVYGTMFENGRLSAESPHYVKIRSQLLTLGANKEVHQRYVAAYALDSLPQDAEVTKALERLAKDPSDYVRNNAAKAVADRAERFKSGGTPPVR